jgi:hypothetical protein
VLFALISGLGKAVKLVDEARELKASRVSCRPISSGASADNQ